MIIKLFGTLIVFYAGIISLFAQYNYLDKYRNSDLRIITDLQLLENQDDTSEYSLVGITHSCYYNFESCVIDTVSQTLGYAYFKESYPRYAYFDNNELIFLSQRNKDLSDIFKIVSFTDYNGDSFYDAIIYKKEKLFVSLNDSNTKFLKPDKITKISIEDAEYRLFDFENIIFENEKLFERIFFNQNSEVLKNSIPKKILADKRVVSINKAHNKENLDILLLDKDSSLYLISIGLSTSPLTNLNIKTETESNIISYLNKDDFPDLIMFARNEVFFRLNNGDNTFQDKQILYKDNDIYSKMIACQDIDNDKDNDIILYNKDRIVFLNDGNANFTKIHENEVDYDMKGFSITDIDDDADSDIILNSCIGLVIFENLGNSFSEPIIIRMCRYFDFYFLIDINADNKKDILFKDECYYDLFWCKRTEKGFAPPQSLKAPLSGNK
ncbi:MAG: hypothetical protein PHW83_04650 [Bacteroidales bacterium]|nr:hypothetical protein [Bacteroidales bacterium]